MIDIHSHILPNIDDGAKDIDMALEMLKIAEDDGTKAIIATPHYFRGYFENEFRDVLKYTNDLKQRAVENNINIDILPGHEVYLDHNTVRDFNEGRVGTLNDSRYMLVELPMAEEFKEAVDIIYELRLLEIVPIIAHPERYSYIRKQLSKINEFISEGCLFQINSGSISGLFGKEVQKTSETLINHGISSFIASDAHTSNRRSPVLKTIMEKHFKDGKQFSEFGENTKYLINNRDIKFKGEKIKEKNSIFSFFRT